VLCVYFDRTNNALVVSTSKSFGKFILLFLAPKTVNIPGVKKPGVSQKSTAKRVAVLGKMCSHG